MVFSYSFAASALLGCLAKSIAPVERQKVDEGTGVLVLKPIINLNWLPGLVCKPVYDGELDYRRYGGVVDGEEGLPADVLADVVYDLDNIFTQKAL